MFIFTLMPGYISWYYYTYIPDTACINERVKLGLQDGRGGVDRSLQGTNIDQLPKNKHNNLHPVRRPDTRMPSCNLRGDSKKGYVPIHFLWEFLLITLIFEN